MSTSKEGDRPEIQEETIIELVREVCEDDNEDSFAKLRAYLDSYIKLFGRRYKIPGCDADEIEQECLCALRYKAIEDFDATRGKFRSFAILCIKRHLFSLIKSSKQQKRIVQNQALSLDEDRSDGEGLSLGSLAESGLPSAEESFIHDEGQLLKLQKLVARLSVLEQKVLRLYIQQYRYDEMVDELRKINAEEKFTDRKITKKSIDNALQRIRQKAQSLADLLDWI